MKKHIIFSLFCVILLSAVCVLTGCKDENQSDTTTTVMTEEAESSFSEIDNYDLPAKVVLEDYLDYPFMAWLYPVGWSESGYFAYMTFSDESDGVGWFIDFHVYVQNMVNDKNVYQLDYMGETYECEDFEFFDDDDNYVGYDVALKTIWSYYSDEINKNLNEYEIVPVSQNFQPFSLEYNDSVYDAEVVDVEIDEEGEMWNNLVESFRVELTKDGIAKTVYTFKDDDDYLRDAEAIGYLKNPFEPRIAIVLLENHPGFEFSDDYDYTMIGAHLIKGYE